MHQVWKLHCVLNEENRHVVADQIPVALVGVELHGETAYVACRVFGSPLAGHGRKTHKHRCDLAGLLERRGFGHRSHGLVGFEKAVGARAACVHDALGNALMVEVRELFAQDEVFKQGRAAHAHLQ